MQDYIYSDRYYLVPKTVEKFKSDLYFVQPGMLVPSLDDTISTLRHVVNKRTGATYQLQMGSGKTTMPTPDYTKLLD